MESNFGTLDGAAAGTFQTMGAIILHNIGREFEAALLLFYKTQCVQAIRCGQSNEQVKVDARGVHRKDIADVRML